MDDSVRRLLLISGSLRDGSTNTATLRTAATLVPVGVAAQLYSEMAALPYFDPDRDREPLPSAVQDLRQAVRDADAILLCTPEYAGALPGAFKNLLEWLIGDADDRSISSKPVGWINASSAPTGARDAHASLRTVLTYAGAPIVLAESISVPRTAISNGLISDPAIVANLTAVLRTLIGARD